MKKIGLIIFSWVLLFGTSVFAADNFLNTVILEGVENGGYNIMLRSDAIASVRRVIENDNKIILNIKGLTASDDINTMYRNTSSANGVIVENVGNNEVKIQIQGKNISKANIIFDSPASAPVVVSEKISGKTVSWILIALFALCAAFAKSRKLKGSSDERINAAVQKSIKEREIAMYRNYRREMLTKPSIDYKITSPRMKQAIKQADTIRHLQRISRV